jgi:hypothetical protein
VQEAYRKLAAHLKDGGRVVFPSDGVGTGLALLHEKAPSLNDFMTSCYKHLMRIHYEATRPAQCANIPS